MMPGTRRGRDTGVHKRDQENRMLQQELRAEKEKLNSTMIKYQREMTEMQAVSRPHTRKKKKPQDEHQGGFCLRLITELIDNPAPTDVIDRVVWEEHC